MGLFERIDKALFGAGQSEHYINMLLADHIDNLETREKVMFELYKRLEKRVKKLERRKPDAV